MYDGERPESTKLKVNLADYEETLKDAKESRLKMKDKMIQLDYAKLNALYESFVPQTEVPVEQTYFSSPSTSNVSSKSSSEKSDLPSKKIPNESKLLKLFVNLDNEIKQLGKLINDSLQREEERVNLVQEIETIKLEFQKLFNSIKATQVQHQQQVNELIENVNQKTYAYGNVRAKNQDLLMTISEVKAKLKGVASSSSVRRPESKDTKSKKRVIMNTKSKSTFKDVKKSQSSVSLVSNKNWQKWFENQSSFNWSPKSSNAQKSHSVSKSSPSARTHSKTPITTQKWVAKLSTPPSEFVSCYVGSGYQQKDRKPSQNDKTEHGMEKTVQNQGQKNNDLTDEAHLHKEEIRFKSEYVLHVDEVLVEEMDSLMVQMGYPSQLPEIDPTFSTLEVSICTPPHLLEKNKNVDEGQNEHEFDYGTDNESKEYDNEDEIDENIEDGNVCWDLITS
ncbi:hypothetical protein Tco_1351170 [Tanacetum coccineum]